EDALTAARAANMALFRELFPGEVVTTGQCISVSGVTLLVIMLEGAGRLYETLGDNRAFQIINDSLKTLEKHIRQDGGALIKSLGEGAVASFPNSGAAVRAAVNLAADLKKAKLRQAVNENASLSFRLGIHHGPAMATTINDHLDYFGVTVHQVMKLLSLGGPGELIISPTVAADGEVAALLRQQTGSCRIFQADLPCYPNAVLHAIQLDQ
ncbi:MAG TPA: adenylate/guanylate cyclase domain-containing protein, partial [Gemmataceae bacterium]|nr:adenylate/guanylate cyclase domain-containing protein [Gemmataceae bacterium]